MSVNENWIKNSTLKDYKQQAIKLSDKNKVENKGKKQVTIPHPSIPKTFILKYI